MLRYSVVIFALVVTAPARAESGDCPTNMAKYHDAIAQLENRLTERVPIGSRFQSWSMPLDACQELRSTLKPAVEAIKGTRDCGYDDMRLRDAEFLMAQHGCSPASLE